MGYNTDFEGEIVVTPKLPDSFVDRWNTAIEGTPGKGYVEPDMVPGFGHPEIRDWCQWELQQTDTATVIRWNEAEKFSSYVAWLKALVGCILKEHPESQFSGAIIACSTPAESAITSRTGCSCDGPRSRASRTLFCRAALVAYQRWRPNLPCNV